MLSVDMLLKMGDMLSEDSDGIAMAFQWNMKLIKNSKLQAENKS